jgi:hypothetical protein
VDGTVRDGAVESNGAAEDGGGGGVAEADGRDPDITDTRLIGFRILPGISLSK